MRKFLLMILIITSTSFLLTGCNDSTSLEEVLKIVNIEIDKIYLTESFDDIIVAFYKEKKTGHQTVGLFNNVKDEINFIIQFDLEDNILPGDRLTVNAILQDKTNEYPEFSFQFGVIIDNQIENVNLHMTDNSDFSDRYAKLVELDDLRVWYSYIDTKRIFNIQQGISKDGIVIYSN